MQKWGKILLCAAFSFMFVFISVGYAQLTDNLSISGTVEVKEVEAVYITSVTYDKNNTSNITNTPSFEIVGTASLIFRHHDYILKHQPRTGNTPGGKITIQVTVKNNSGRAQYLSELSSTLDANNTQYKNYKSYCTVECKQTGEDRKVEHGATKTYTFVIQNTKKQQKNSDNYNLSMDGFESLLVFSPKLEVSDTENATQSLAAAFANVLAGKGPNGDGVGIIYKGKTIAADQIMVEITKKMTDVETGGYTGNVGNATQDEKDLMAAVFGDNIVIQIGANYYSVYILIKNQEINNDNNKDMVIYVTADQLDQGGGEWKNNQWQNMNIVPVYGLVFIKQKDGTYMYCNHLFAGEAPVCDFGGALGEGKVGNFHTNIWNSTEFSSVTDTSGGSIGQQYITTNGELDEAYQYFIKDNPGALIDPGTLQ